ncbi:FAD-binding oxidoreductase [Gordonia sp. CPCC 205515]|uniref:NAD(P)/FAD-dependent oxidoreductase n=1 Tax=Gordonia sp. CPCC 205515 TaxID=3140791 RepID=UPI003AF3A6A9
MHTTVFERRPADANVINHSLAHTDDRVFWIDDVERDRYDSLHGEVEADLVVVGGGYTGLWTALRAVERQPDLRVVLLEGHRVGWAASGRNGGFCEASLTHGRENGMARWPDEMPALERMGQQNLDDIEDTVARYGIKADLERTGALSVAVEPHQVAWLAEGSDSGDEYFDEAGIRAQVNSPTYLAGTWDRRGNMLIHPARLAVELARTVSKLGVTIFEASQVTRLENEGSRVRVHTDAGVVTADRVALGTNVFPSLLKRNRLMTVPVYDHVLATEPLSEEQLAEIGWQQRQGISDLANQFHYYRLTADNRIVFGGYDAIYHFGRKMKRRYEHNTETTRRLASHFFTTFPQLEGIRFSHKWGGAIDTSTQFCAFFGTAMTGKVAYATGFTGLGVAATRFASDVMLDLLAGEQTERTELEMVRKRPLPFPPEPLASIGINLTRWSLDRADHAEGRRNVFLKAMDAVGLGFDS